MLAPALAATSQALGLLQLILLFHNVPSGRASDAYFYLYNWGLLPTQMILLGVVYPLWLRSVPLGRLRVARIVAGVSTASGAAALLATFILVLLGKGYHGIWLHAALLAGVGAVAAVGWAGALRSAALGRPAWLSSVTLLSSLFACLALAAPASNLGDRVTRMCVGLLVGSAVFAVLVILLGTRATRDETLSVVRPGSNEPGWYLLKSVIGYGAAISLQSMTASLATSSLSSLNIVIKVVSGFSTVVTNTILPRLVHSSSSSADDAFGYGWSVLYLASALGLAAGGAEIALGGRYPALGLIIAAWILASSLSVSSQRVALRFFPASYSAISVGAGLVIPLTVGVLSLLGRLSLSTVLVAYVSLDLVVGVALSAIMGGRRLALASAIVASVMTVCGVISLHGSI